MVDRARKILCLCEILIGAAVKAREVPRPGSAQDCDHRSSRKSHVRQKARKVLFIIWIEGTKSARPLVKSESCERADYFTIPCVSRNGTEAI